MAAAHALFAFAPPPLHRGRGVAVRTARTVSGPRPRMLSNGTARTPRPRDIATPPPPTSLTRAQLLQQQSLHPADAPLFDTLSAQRALLFSRVLHSRTTHFTFVLDGVQGAHNLAAIVRSCDANAIQQLHVISDKPPEPQLSLAHRFEYDQSVRQVSKGSHKWLTISEHHAVADCVKTLKQQAYRIIVSSVSPSAKPLSSIDLSSKCAFVFGNERVGVTELMNQHADELFTIPMMGFVESMNVSVAVATTACLIMHRVKHVLPSSSFLLSAQQRRQLAHTWLTQRRTQRARPKPMRTKRDMTRLGARKEALIVAKGLFSSPDTGSVSDAQFWQQSFRLAADSGVLLSTYLCRRKFGALADNSFANRCATICDGVAGTHALSFEAVRRSVRSSATRSGLLSYLKRLCRSVSDSYAPYFDTHGINGTPRPLLPLFAAESQSTLEQVHASVWKVCHSICLEVAREEFGLSDKDTNGLIASVDANWLVECILDSVHCNDATRRTQFAQLAHESSVHKQQLLQLVAHRHARRELLVESDAACAFKPDAPRLNDAQRDALQAMLRLSQAASICSATHRAAWRRELHAEYKRELHAPTCGLVEANWCEAAAEMMLLRCAPALVAGRLLLECEQTLAPLRAHVARARRAVSAS